MRIVELCESLNTSYDVHFTTKNRAYFITHDGETYVIDFDGAGTANDPVEISFYWIDSIDNSWMQKGKNILPYQSQRPLRVISTVVHAVETYIERNQPYAFYFTGKGHIADTYQTILRTHKIKGFDRYKMTHQQSLSQHVFMFERW